MRSGTPDEVGAPATRLARLPVGEQTITADAPILSSPTIDPPTAHQAPDIASAAEVIERLAELDAILADESNSAWQTEIARRARGPDRARLCLGLMALIAQEEDLAKREHLLNRLTYFVGPEAIRFLAALIRSGESPRMRGDAAELMSRIEGADAASAREMATALIDAVERDPARARGRARGGARARRPGRGGDRRGRTDRRGRGWGDTS